LGARSGNPRRARAQRAAALASTAFAAAALAACGGGERQDADEPEGTFEVEVVEARFPSEQKLAKRSELRISVRNAGSETIPNVAVTVKGFEHQEADQRLADPNRPTFVINGEPASIGGLPESRPRAPRGGDTSYVGTWALGQLAPGKTKTFTWDVTAVHPGPYRVEYRVAAGLDGKAKAVLAGGAPPRGVFTGTVEDEPPDSRVGEDGRTVIRGDGDDDER
jgi:hypothetical protein